MWDLPGLGLEPVSPALAGGFLTTAPPGKPAYIMFCLLSLTLLELSLDRVYAGDPIVFLPYMDICDIMIYNK